MTELETAPAAYDVDRAYAPVGLFVLTFWMSSLVMGLFGFAISIATAKGMGPFVKDEVHGIFDGLIIFGILLIISIAMGLLGRSLILKGKSVNALWRVSYLAIPAIMLVLSIVALVVNN